MENQTEYFTITKQSTATHVVKGSKFIGIAFPFEKESELKAILSLVKSEYKSARHYCFAYKIGVNEYNVKSSDDGEPSGTAGKPILGQINSFGLTNILIVVVRYFGGVLLGTGGLTQAYKIAAKTALESNIIEKNELKAHKKIFVNYKDYALFISDLKKRNFTVISENAMNDKIEIEIEYSIKNHDTLESFLNNYIFII